MTETQMKLDDLFSVAGKSIVVSGGSKGIGLMISSALVQNGAQVFIFSRKPAFDVAEALTKTGPGTCYAFACDVSKAEAIAEVVAAISKITKKVHCLVNNSGAVWADSFDATPKMSFDKLLGVNVTGLFMCTQGFMPLLDAAATPDDPARVINVASIDGLGVPTLEEYAYSASKAAVIQLNRVMAGHLATRNVTFNCISPGLFPSKMSAQLLEVAGEEVATATIPMKRVGRPSEIAAAVIFLASKGGAYTTGANIVIDGGVLCKPRM